MKVFKNAVLTVLILALVVSVCGCAFGGSKKIGKNAALLSWKKRFLPPGMRSISNPAEPNMNTGSMLIPERSSRLPQIKKNKHAHKP